MNNEKQQTAVEWLGNEITNRITRRNPHDTIIIQILGETLIELIEQAKEMQQEQAQLYATFVLMCVNNNLPPITFNDWVTNIRR
jgi:LytS/YehU family sensor histidine kinase